ncbi:MAG: glycosyltransferase [Polyangiaceae bacterium]|nr:glycosyltransferase [Polyangiaceae bacterium]
MKLSGDRVPSEHPHPERLREISREIARCFPAVHGGDRCVLTAVGPRLAYLSWHLDPASIDALSARLGSRAHGACCRVRVHDVTDVLFDGTNAHETLEVAVGMTSGHEYWPVPITERNLLAEVGLALADGSFASLARSWPHWFDRDRPSRRYDLGGLFVSSAYRLVFPVESVLDAPVFERLSTEVPHLDGTRLLRVAVVDVGIGAALTGMVRRVSGELSKLRARVTVFADDTAPPPAVDIVTAAEERAAGLFEALACEHARQPFDLVHCHEWYSVPVALRAHELGLPLVLSLHSTESERSLGGPQTALSRAICDWERRGVAAATLIVVPHAATRQQVIALYDADPVRVVTVPDFSDGPGNVEPDPARAKLALGVESSAPVVLFAGELAHATGADLLADAVPAVCREHPTARFVFAGDGPLRQEIEDRLVGAGLAHRCRFLGDVPSDRFQAVLLASDFVVIPARTWQDEGLAQLAITNGRSVLTTRQANLQCIRHGENGLVTYDNPGSIVWGVKELLANPLGASLQRWLARTRAGHRTTLDRVTVEQFLAYETVAGDRAGAASV